MTESHDPVLLIKARTNSEAKVIVSVLSAAGISAYHGGSDNLMDEFVMTQASMNLQGVDVFVAENLLEDAHRVLAEARAAGEFIESASAPATESAPESDG